MGSEVACPNCGVLLDPPPKQSRKCPDCREAIVLRTDPDSKNKVFLTKSEVEEFDRLKKNRSERNRALRDLAGMDLDETDYRREEKRLSEKFGSNASPGDIYWGLANQTLQKLIADPKNGDAEHWHRNAHQIQMLYWKMGLHLLRENRSREQVQDQQRESHKWRLTKEHRTYLSMRKTSIFSIDVGSCCDTCRILEGGEYTFEKALEEMPLPQVDCEKDWCTCWWVNKLPDDHYFETDSLDVSGLENEDEGVSIEVNVASSVKPAQGCLASFLLISFALLLVVIPFLF